ncbi:MAG TPA: hypothetical protein VHR41_16090 [Gemmatimonadales bacterium]|jgi:hypothetical protein|nr:hypothetical protein [Gemmatimonadales bacterium]
MFLGHYGVAFALKRVEPKISLGTLFVACQLADLLWGCFLLLGWEHARVVPDPNPLLNFEFLDYPISHSLVAALAWGIVGAAAYYSWPTRDTSRHWQASVLVGAAVASHYPLDVLVHLKDLPLAGDDSLKIGLGLWNHFGISIAVELLTLAIGLAVYIRFQSRRHPIRVGRLAVVVLLLVGMYAAALISPPPPGMTIVAVSDIALILGVGALAAWADRQPSPAELAAARAPR